MRMIGRAWRRASCIAMNPAFSTVRATKCTPILFVGRSPSQDEERPTIASRYLGIDRKPFDPEIDLFDCGPRLLQPGDCHGFEVGSCPRRARLEVRAPSEIRLLERLLPGPIGDLKQPVEPGVLHWGHPGTGANRAACDVRGVGRSRDDYRVLRGADRAEIE